MNSQRYSSTTPTDRKPLLAIYATFSPSTSSYVFELYNPFGQLVASDFGRVPEAISDGLAYTLVQAHRAISDRFPDYQVVKCVTELQESEVERCAA
ncbi:MAG: hypothetical protein WBV94_31900 [Blastocatellia bacterium]